jgi:uncharacterized protein (TIGR03067 family)
MHKLIALSAFLALAVPATRAADDDAAKAAKKLEGTYEVVSATRGGKPDEKAKDVESFTFKEGNKIVIATKAGKDMNAKFTLDPAKKPAQIDIMPDNGGAETIKGIYEMKETDKGLEVSIAFARDGGERPKDFKGDADSEIAVKLFKKKAK